MNIPGEEIGAVTQHADYLAFLETKFKFSQAFGFDVAAADVRPLAAPDVWKPHQVDIIRWAVKKGRAALFEAFGLGKSLQQIEILRLIQAREGGRVGICAPLGVRQEFIRDARKLGIEFKFVRSSAEVGGDGFYITNYESIRDGKLDVNLFIAWSLDEASVLRSYGSKTYQEFLMLFGSIKYRFVATATPSPNRYKELIHYAGFLGVMDTGQALTRFFQRDPSKAGNLTLYPHMEAEFFVWLHSWAIFIQRPSDLGYSDEGYDLPPLKVNYHEVKVHSLTGKVERDGQIQLIKDAAIGLKDAAVEKRESIDIRVAKAREIVDSDPDAHFILWHDLEDERHEIKRALPEAVSVYGSQDLDEREQQIVDFSDGKFRILSTKPEIAGSGCNFQRHCHRAIFVGIGYKFNDFIQAIMRLQRFLQAFAVEIDIIYTETEREILAALQRKWAEDEKLRVRMSEIIREHGLSTTGLESELRRSIGVTRHVERGELFEVAHNDCVDECRHMPDNSVDLIHTSVPFGNHYEYSASYNDFGHNENNVKFFAQMDFLTPELLRILRPGRIAAIHVKDRIRFGNVTGYGAPTVDPFHADCIYHYRRHGFVYMGMVTVVTDVVRENNQTYRLGWSEQCKDGTKMGVGSPEYILLFRKLQTDLTRGYADVPVVKSKAEYTRARWQMDAHAHWRSSGNRHLTAAEMEGYGPDQIGKVFERYSLQNVYDHERIVRVGEVLDARGGLPSTFMCLAPGSHHPDVWHDVQRMRTLNGEQTQKGLNNHICLARGSLVLTRERGYVPIETVQVGEQALTHRGRWRRVLVAKCTGVRRTIIVRAQGVPGLTLTPDHKLWTRLSTWVRERDGAEQAAPEWVEAHATLGGYVNLKLPDEESANGESLYWWIVGRWLADGHWDSKGSAIISCGANEIHALSETLGAHAGAVHDTGTAIQIRVLDRSGLIRSTLSACGLGAAGKHLPAQAATLPKEQARALLMGYLSGDGHFLPGRNRWLATSVSRSLALGVAMLAQRVFGVIASVHEGRPQREAQIAGRTIQCRQEWVVSFDSDEQRRKQPFILEDGAWKKVRSLTENGDAEVWCLRVDEDESFTAEGCIVKNCPLQFDIVDRIIERYTNKGELVFDPFGGLFTVPYRAIMLGRRGRAVELNGDYFRDGLAYLRAAERQVGMPDLFGFEELESAA